MINIKELAKRLGISQAAVRIRLSKGKLPNPDKREGDNLFWKEETVKGSVELI